MPGRFRCLSPQIHRRPRSAAFNIDHSALQSEDDEFAQSRLSACSHRTCSRIPILERIPGFAYSLPLVRGALRCGVWSMVRWRRTGDLLRILYFRAILRRAGLHFAGLRSRNWKLALMKRSEFWLVVAAAMAVFASGASLPCLCRSHHGRKGAARRTCLASARGAATRQPADSGGPAVAMRPKQAKTMPRTSTTASSPSSTITRSRNTISPARCAGSHDLEHSADPGDVEEGPRSGSRTARNGTDRAPGSFEKRITVSSVDVDKQIQAILTDNHMTMDQLKILLAGGHVAMATCARRLPSPSCGSEPSRRNMRAASISRRKPSTPRWRG